MDPWSVGLAILVAVGLVVIIYGALSDRRKNQRRAVEMLAPPRRDIPQFKPDAAAPHYLSELQARRTPTDAASLELGATERESLKRRLQDPDTVTVQAGYAGRDFVTDPRSGWAVVPDSRVLVCGEAVTSIRELLPVAEKMIMTRTPLVVVAPSFADEVIATLAVNHIQRTMRLLAVTADDAARQTVANTTDAATLARSDLQSGYLLPEHLGSCPLWVSDAKRSYLLTGADAR